MPMSNQRPCWYDPWSSAKSLIHAHMLTKLIKEQKWRLPEHWKHTEFRICFISLNTTHDYVYVFFLLAIQSISDGFMIIKQIASRIYTQVLRMFCCRSTSKHWRHSRHCVMLGRDQHDQRTKEKLTCVCFCWSTCKQWRLLRHCDILVSRPERHKTAKGVFKVTPILWLYGESAQPNS